jgi:actin-related protein 2
LPLDCLLIATTLTLPDGRVLKVGPERFEAPEALFQPTMIDVESKGLAELVFDCIQSCDMSTRPDLYKHIVLSGGSTMYPGLPSRLEKEVRKLHCDLVCKGDKEQVRSPLIALDCP